MWGDGMGLREAALRVWLWFGYGCPRGVPIGVVA